MALRIVPIPTRQVGKTHNSWGIALSAQEVLSIYSVYSSGFSREIESIEDMYVCVSPYREREIERKRGE